MFQNRTTIVISYLRNYLLDKLRKLSEWNGHLEMFSGSKVVEKSRQYLLLRTEILQKTVVECP